MPVPFFLKSRSVRAHQSHVLGQDQSTVAEQAATTVAECFLMSCVQARYPDRFPHCACTAASSSNSDFVKSTVYACSDITRHPHFWQNDRDLLRATAVTRGWNGHRIRVSTQRKRWEDNIREWTGLEFAESQKAVENRGKWRKLVAKSSVVPQRPSQLRDR